MYEDVRLTGLDVTVASTFVRRFPEVRESTEFPCGPCSHRACRAEPLNHKSTVPLQSRRRRARPSRSRELFDSHRPEVASRIRHRKSQTPGSKRRIVFPWEAPFLIKIAGEFVSSCKSSREPATSETYHAPERTGSKFVST